jgi:outer membrane protein
MRSATTILSLLLLTTLTAQNRWTLQQCVQRAEERSLGVRNAQLTAELAGRTNDQARWNFVPSLSGGGTHGYNYGRVVDRFTNTFATDRVRTNNFWFTSDINLYEGDRKWNTLRQSELDERASMKGLEAARNEVQRQVVTAYLNVLGLRERIRTAEAQLGNTRVQLERTVALVEAGRSALVDRLDMEAQLASEEYTVTELRNQEAQAMMQLAQVMMLDERERMAFDVEMPPIGDLAIAEPTANEEEVLRSVIATNPAYAQLQLAEQSAERGVAVARAGRLPTLSFNASVGTGYSGRNIEAFGAATIVQVPIGSTSSGETVFVPQSVSETRTRAFGNQLDDNLNQSLSFTLNVPILNNKLNSLAVDRARIQHEQARNDLEARWQGLQRDVQNALVAQRNAYRQYLSARRSSEAAELSLQAAQERFERGVITVIELNTAKLRLQQAQANLINAKYDYLRAQKSLDILQGLTIAL